MKRVKIMVDQEYDVIIGENILNRSGEFMPKSKIYNKAYIITDDNVLPIYFESVGKSLEKIGLKVFKHILPNGELSKSVQALKIILEDMAENGFDREDIVIALGGGVIGDISGLAAAVYLRGIDYIQIPTTFLSAIDSSVGGKTAVNLEHGKNLMGAFKQPLAVIFDVVSLNTLNDEIFADGTAEAIKYGVLKSPSLFKKLCNFSRSSLMEIMPEIVSECVAIKGEIVSCDEFDRGERQLLNFGHTIGHSIEKCSGYAITHGRAVAAGMAVITKGAAKLGLIPNFSIYDQICEALKRHELPIKCDFSACEIYNSVLSDKKRKSENINIVLPAEIGRCELKKISLETMYSIIKEGLDG
ncbi:MAG: 3-dehydroquinate synthase [Eubacterium sp.]|jgi:3-dehydroquinate synthase|nr:3-dehydroquinate synthase [Eubacterium sp.]